MRTRPFAWWRVIAWAEEGLNFVVHSSDYAAMRDAIAADVCVMRAGMDGRIDGDRALRAGAGATDGETFRPVT